MQVRIVIIDENMLPRIAIYFSKRKKIFYFLFWVVFLLGIFVNSKECRNVKISFDASVGFSKSNNRVGQLYFDTGSGFNEKESVKFHYFNGNPDQFYHYSIVLPVCEFNRLRFDPLQDSGNITIMNLLIGRGHITEMETSKDNIKLIPINAIESIRYDDNGIEIRSNGEDPYLAISINNSFFSISNILSIINQMEIDKLIAGFLFLISFSLLIVIFV